MSMADQYQDGRYDGIPEDEVDELLHPCTWGNVFYSPDILLTGYLGKGHGGLADGHGFAHTSIGYVPITAPRGGIKYPTQAQRNMAQRDPATMLRTGAWDGTYTPPKKETHMPKPQDKVQRIEAALDVNLTLQKSLKEQENDLRQQLRTADIPAPPPADYTMFLAEVQFAEGGAIYEYLIHRHVDTDQWCTTGSKPDQKRFTSWEKLCAWLNSAYWHGNLSVLQVVEPRRFPTVHTMAPPF